MATTTAAIIFFSLLVTISATITSAIHLNFTTFNIAPTPSPISQPPLPSLSDLPQPPPTHLQDSPQQQQFNSIIDSIVGAGDFSNWANLLAQADPSLFPLTATLFVPEDGAFLPGNAPPPATSGNSIDALLFPYHIVPRRFTFAELRQFPCGARLPTLLPGKTLLITNTSASNYTINGVLIGHPDLFQSSIVAVHGIKNVLDYEIFGEDAASPGNSVALPENTPDTILSSPLPELKQNPRRPENEVSSAAKAQGEMYMDDVGTILGIVSWPVLIFLLLAIL
ncbi:hypothetical protein SOVF_145900 [Spinacia oleracea]|uniref:Fasciclin-like arabinogalactan protein 21 n=1 Tax=Spinacia oleracea TaxID=3562 RepID=A0A9R0JEH3_SPIOL|nr:fasciclin-like arabinogalactan protein 21 [Spinacia oleracea]KNA10273.1 hypothetical protein SOVF_145900 [Spinacia oleracea]